MAPPAVLGTATLFCRPLRFLFDVESVVAVLRNEAYAGPPLLVGGDHDVLAHVHVHISLSFAENGSTPRSGHDATGKYDDAQDELAELVGRFARVRVRLQLAEELERPGISTDAAWRSWRVQYQLSPATESFVLPVDHTNVFSVLVTDEFVAHITTRALQFNFLAPRQRDDDDDGDSGSPPRENKPAPVKTPRPAEPPAPAVALVSAEEAEAARRLTEAAANAAHSAAQAAREAARAATDALAEAKSAAVRQRDADAQAHTRAVRDQQLEREALAAQDKARASDAAAAAAKAQEAAALERQQLEHALSRAREEKQRLGDDAERLARALDDKDAALGAWQRQTAATDAAIELLQQRLDGDAKERDALQQRLRVLEEEKLELLRKSRACVVQ